MPTVRVLRTAGAALVSVLLVLAVVLSLTVVLLPVGLLLGYAAFRLYRLGLRPAMPRAGDVTRGVRKEARRSGPPRRWGFRRWGPRRRRPAATNSASTARSRAAFSAERSIA